MDRSSCHRAHRAVFAQRGMTLIELMVGLTLGLILVAALLTVFANASLQGQNVGRSSAQIENGRYVTELLQDEVRMAGFVGELSTKSVKFDDPAPCSTDPSTAFSYDAPTYTTTVPSGVQGIGAAEVLNCLSHRRAGTEALVVRRLDTSTVAASAVKDSDSQYYTQYSFCSTDPATTLVYGKTKAGFTLQNSACTGAADVRAYVTRIYFIADCNDCSGSGDGVPTLKRVELQGSTMVETALADGVENMQLEYGFDTDGNGDVDTYQSALNADATQPTGKWSNVMSVRVHIITRSPEKTAGSGLSTVQTFNFGQLDPVSTPADGYSRKGYSTVVRLMNPAGARESQS